MWIFANDAALSIVAHRDKPDVLLVRARIRGDIEKVFPGATVSRTPQFDYAYRAEADRETVAEVIAKRLVSIKYDNFKNSIEWPDDMRHDAYLNVWADMLDYQSRAAKAEENERTRTSMDDLRASLGLSRNSG